MGNLDLAIRFTEDKYYTKNDISRELKTSLVDHIWDNVIQYRKPLFQRTGLYQINNSEYQLCLCSNLSNKINECNDIVSKYINTIGTVFDNDYLRLQKQSVAKCLKCIAAANGIDSSDINIQSVLHGEVKSYDNNSLLIRYNRCLDYINSHYKERITIDSFYALYGILTGNNDASFRNINDDNPTNNILIDRVYSSAPAHKIEPMISSLVDFINSSSFAPIVKASIAYFYINMVKPYSMYSKEIAILVSKYILCNSYISNSFTLVNLEEILLERKDVVDKYFLDCQKYSDITYFVRYSLELFAQFIAHIIDSVVNFKTQMIKEEFYQPEETIEEKPIETPIEEHVEESPMVIEKPIEEIKVVEKAEKVEPVIQKEEKPVVQPTNTKIAVSYIPPAIDEKEASRLEEHLLELEPELKKGEAKFYARHCVLGKMYTIQQYKKSIGCVYETARTSMEHLVKLGYYRKEQIKNKFVYTPVERD